MLKRKTLEIIKGNGGSGELLKFDVADREEVRKVIDGWKMQILKNS
jgi:hypothetical protein